MIKTDHKSLAYLTEQNLHSDMQRKAMTRLMGLQFKVIYKKDKDNQAADALSRVGHLLALQAISQVQPQWVQEVINSYVTDSRAQELLSQLAVHTPNDQGYSLHQGLIRYQGRLWVGANSAIQTKIIAAFHSSAVGGHSGQHATYHRIKRLFCWKGLKQDVAAFISQCHICQQAKHLHTHPQGLLQPLPITAGAWQDISLDFIEGLPKSNGYDVILVVVDRFTKYAHFVPLKHPYSAISVARLLFDTVVKLHGLPHSMVSDRDKVFTSHVWKELFKLLGVQLQLSTAYHPQTDGQTERVNQCLEMYLRCSVGDSPSKWHSWLPQAEFWYNSSHHSSLGCSPFKALYGHDPFVGVPVDTPSDAPPLVADFLADHKLHSVLLKEHLEKARKRMKLLADRSRTDVSFQVGDKVLLKLQPYAQSSVVNRPFPKMAMKYYGPFTVLQKIGQAAYTLDLPPTSLIHPTFHVSQLKAYTPDHTPVFSDLPPLVSLDGSDVLPETVLDRRLVKKGGRAVPQVLIKWTKLPATSATWEDYYVPRQRFPEALAWGHARSPGGQMS